FGRRRARAVSDKDLRTEPLRQPLTDQARDDVSWAAGGKTDNDAHGPAWIGLRPCNAGYVRQRGSTRGQMQKISAGKVHFEPPSSFRSFDHLLGDGEHALRNGEAEQPPGLSVADQLELAPLCHPQAPPL